MSNVGKAALLERRANTREVDVPDVGTVTVRGLTRTEALAIRGVEMDEAVAEQKLLAVALVDPKLTEDDVRQWQEASPAGEIEVVTAAVLALSGMNAEAPKETVAAFRG